jgi:hypothetical protein
VQLTGPAAQQSTEHHDPIMFLALRLKANKGTAVTASISLVFRLSDAQLDNAIAYEMVT